MAADKHGCRVWLSRYGLLGMTLVVTTFVLVLLADGSVLPVPADVVRDAVARVGRLVVLDAAGDGQLRAVAVGSLGVE